jgi:hypothetical protein
MSMPPENVARPKRRAAAVMGATLLALSFAAGMLVQKHLAPSRWLKGLISSPATEAEIENAYLAPVDPRLVRAFGAPTEIYDGYSPYYYASGAEAQIPKGLRFSEYRYYPFYKQAEEYLRGSKAKEMAREVHDEFWRTHVAGPERSPGDLAPQRTFLKEALGVRDLMPNGRVVSRVRIASKAAYTIDKLEIESRAEGITTPLYVATPIASPAKGVVIALHGHSSSPEHVVGLLGPDYTRAFGAELAKRGYVVYAPYVFNVSSYNAKMGALGMLYSGETKYSLDIQKLLSVVDLIKADRSASELPLILWGVSYGGRLAMFMSGLDERIEVTVVNGAFKHHRDFLEDNFSFGSVGHTWVEDVLLHHPLYRHFDSVDLARLIAPRPLLLELPAYDLGPFPETIIDVWKRIERLYAAENAGSFARLVWFKGHHETAPALTIPAIDSVVEELRR